MSNSVDYKISIIVPVYNIERYLEKNIQSLINQNINMEIIYVDDGSVDNSAEIIKKYMHMDDRIKLFQKENGGAGSARNYGLEKSLGKYVIFIDGDDFIEESSLEILYNIAEEEKLDIIHGGYRIVDDNGNNISKSNNKAASNTGCSLSGAEWLVKKSLLVTVWVYLFNRQYLIDNNLLFYENIYHEDDDFIYRAIYFADKIKAVDLCFYNYVQREGSFMRTVNIKKCIDLVEIADRYKEFTASYVDENSEADTYIFFKKLYIYLYVRSLNSAVLQGIPLKALLKDEKLKDKLILEIAQSDRKKHKIITYILKFNLYCIYEKLYLVKEYLKRGY